MNGSGIIPVEKVKIGILTASFEIVPAMVFNNERPYLSLLTKNALVAFSSMNLYLPDFRL